jgi:hypothetical protein
MLGCHVPATKCGRPTIRKVWNILEFDFGDCVAEGLGAAGVGRSRASDAFTGLKFLRYGRRATLNHREGITAKAAAQIKSDWGQ